MRERFVCRKVGPSRALAPIEHIKLGARVPLRRAAVERPGIAERVRPQRAIFKAYGSILRCLGAGGAHKIGLQGLFLFPFFMCSTTRLGLLPCFNACSAPEKGVTRITRQ